MTQLQTAINGHKQIAALKDKTIHVYKEGKMSFVKLVISDGAVYAASIREELPVIGTAVVTNMKMLGGRDLRPTDQIRITDVLPTTVIGEIFGP